MHHVVGVRAHRLGERDEVVVRRRVEVDRDVDVVETLVADDVRFLVDRVLVAVGKEVDDRLVALTAQGGESARRSRGPTW